MEIKLKIEASQDVLDAINALASALNRDTTEKPKAKKKVEVTEEPTLQQEVEAVEKERAEAQTYTIEQVKEIGQKVAALGKKDAVKALIGKYGVAKLSDLAESDFNDFVKDVNSL
jgi:hypothetical protein